MKKSNIIIGILVIILLIMTGFVAYYSGVLLFGKKSDSNWNVTFVNIQSKDQVGEADNDGAPIYDKTSATFKTILVNPGDSITYEVTIENKGKIDAKVKKINISEVNNEAIVFDVSGVKEGQVLKAKEKQTMLVTVSYNKDFQNEPESLKSTLTVKIDYERK